MIKSLSFLLYEIQLQRILIILFDEAERPYLPPLLIMVEHKVNAVMIDDFNTSSELIEQEREVLLRAREGKRLVV